MDEIQVMDTPRSIDIAITGRCNLTCAYCFYNDEMVARRDLPTATWLSFFEELSRIGVMDVTLTGGEVFTRPDVFELIDGVIANRMRYSLLTNATLITEKTLARFEEGKRRVRLNSIQVSIDGSRAEVHNQSRPKSFDRSVRGLRLLKDAGFPVTVRVTINRHNVNDLENIAHLLLDEIGIPSFTTNDAMPIGAGCQNQGDVSLTHAEQVQVMNTMARLLERYPGRLTATAGPQARIKVFADMEQARKTGEKNADWTMGYLSSCGCIYNKLSVLHDGAIVPCHVLYGTIMGNITTDSFETIWRAHPALKALRERRFIPMQQVSGCQACEWASYCSGGCPGVAQQMSGDFNVADPLDCYRRFLMETGHVNH